MSLRVREAGVALVLSCVLAVALTWPLAPRLASAGRVDSGDGRHGVWNVAWVAHALTTQPSQVFNANIFHPHKQTLAYSEANLLAGALAIPAWVISDGNPYAAYNSVVLLAFVLAALSAYALARQLGASYLGAALAGLIYGFCPYMLAHLPHIQLLMTFGPALSLLALHRFVMQPSTPRAVILGLALAITGLACAYYGVFAGMVVSVGVLWFAVTEGHWKHRAYWLRAALAAGIVALILIPAFLPYLDIRDEGFARTLDDARRYSTKGRAYLASAMWLHRWMLPIIESWSEVLFPGFVAVAGTIAALSVTVRRGFSGQRHIIGFYATMMVLAFWISLGPDAGLYTALYHAIPAFSFLRAPVRIGILVTLGAAVLTALVATWLAQRRASQDRLALVGAIAVATFAVAESWAGPIALVEAHHVNKAYRRLAAMPRGPVAEFPFYQGAAERHRQTEYMLMSTYHWQPLVNGYSDHMPSSYVDAKPILAGFPSADAFDVLNDLQVRWVVVHFNRYPEEYRRTLRPLMRTFPTRLRTVIDDTEVGLYEVIWPRLPVEPPLP